MESRIIKFRGKNAETREWVYGYLCENVFKQLCIQPIGEWKECVPVDPTTVGQFTGLTDKNGIDIYEGAVCLFAKEKIGVERYREIIFEQGCFIAVQYLEDGRRVLSSAFGRDGNTEDYKIAGNIHDNPELLNP